MQTPSLHTYTYTHSLSHTYTHTQNHTHTRTHTHTHNTIHTPHTYLFFILTLVGVDEASEREVTGGVDPQCVVDGVVLLILRDDQSVGLSRLGLHHLTQVVRAVDPDTIFVRRRVI